MMTHDEAVVAAVRWEQIALAIHQGYCVIEYGCDADGPLWGFFTDPVNRTGWQFARSARDAMLLWHRLDSAKTMSIHQ